ncbi:GIY-YIG nuclease family protein [Janthinobacterium sp. JC611]|uniref:GIY-YIG nuclease family protein n=1 Tax=Janthinobacterium sp. JC611 TaxID=2816201 RepID=UPI001BFE0458|nr:GIY-YIG nuclease family protein [Janthinobacterium sp. JC611]
MQMSNLYILVFRDGDYIKIGKADDIHARIAVLQRIWGPVDYGASYYLQAPLPVVRQVEGALLSLLAQFAVSVMEGDGKTELRAKPALPIALQYLEIYCANKPELGGLKMGVVLPPSPQGNVRRRGRRDRLLRKSICMTRSISDMAKKFGMINRLLTVLHRRQTRIPFEYERSGDQICFRVRRPISVSSLDSESSAVMAYFRFQIEDQYGWGGFNFCSVAGSADVVQFNVNFSSSGVKEWEAVISYFVAQSMTFLDRLPTRSAATKEPIPPLNW